MVSSIGRIVEKLKDKKYRDAFASEFVDTWLPFQIRSLREQRGWSQRELGKRMRVPQEQISRLEDPNYCRFSLSTLKRLSNAFDVGLKVRFVAFSELVTDVTALSSESYQVPSFAADPGVVMFAQKRHATAIDISAGTQQNNILNRDLSLSTRPLTGLPNNNWQGARLNATVSNPAC